MLFGDFLKIFLMKSSFKITLKLTCCDLNNATTVAIVIARNYEIIWGSASAKTSLSSTKYDVALGAYRFKSVGLWFASVTLISMSGFKVSYPLPLRTTGSII